MGTAKRHFVTSPGASPVIKNQPAMWETEDSNSISGLGRSPGG